MINLIKTAKKETYPIKASLLIGVLLIAANLRAPITSLGPVLPEIRNYFSLSSEGAGLLNALPLLIFASASPIAPWLERFFGLERSLFGALSLIAVGCLMRSGGSFSGLWCGTLMLSTGVAVANVLVVPLVKRDFPQHTVLCVGLYAATMALFAALASGLSAPLSMLSSYGWKASLGIWFALATCAGICWWPRIRDPVLVGPMPSNVSRRNLWGDAIAWQISMFLALQTMTFYTLIDWFPTIVKSVGINANEAGGYLFVYQAIAVASNLITSFLLKFQNDQRLFGFIGSFGSVVGLFGLLQAPSLALTWLLIAGAGAGISMVTCLSLFSLRAKNHHLASSLSAMAQCVGYGVGATGPFWAGWLHESFGSWDLPLEGLVGCACLQTLFAVLAGRNQFIT